MTNDKKVAIQQQHIKELEQEIQRLKQENEVLKQMIPDGTNVQPVKKVYALWQNALAEATLLKKQYEAANEAIKIVKQNYEAEVNELLTRLRGDVTQAEARRSQMAQEKSKPYRRFPRKPFESFGV